MARTPDSSAFVTKTMSIQPSIQIRIRTATAKDLPSLEWEGEYTHFRRLFQQAYQQSQLRQGDMYLAEIPGVGIVGQAFVQYNSNRYDLADGHQRAYVYSVRVKSAYRDQGIGTRLLQTIENDLKARGFHYVTLNVAQDNPDARRLYERLGYRVIGDDPGEWQYIDHTDKVRHVKEPAWRMEKRIR